MAYRLDLGADPDEALRAAALDRLDHALGALQSSDAAKGVHDARKDVKKTRALLRLHRDGLGRKTYRRENRALRDAGRALSGQRDADVLAATVDDLADRYAGRVPATGFRHLRGRVTRPAPAQAHDPAATATAALGEIRERAATWSVRHPDLPANLAERYARGRAEYKVARRDPTDEHLHDWRKRAKDLRYGLELLEDAGREVVAPQAKLARTLSELLGDDHDLAVLAERAHAGPEPLTAHEEEVLALAARRRAELRAEALRLGGLLYAETPKAFARRLTRYLRVPARA